MSSLNEEVLFKYAMLQIDAAGIAPSRWTLGGGTVLKEFLHHRYSEDIDVFLDDPQLLNFLSPRLNEANDGSMRNYSESGNAIQLRFDEGKVDFIVAGKVTDIRGHAAFFHGREVVFDDPVEIVGKKIYHRGDHFHPRDCFDLACLYLTDRREDLITFGVQHRDKIAALEKRIERIRSDAHFFKAIAPLDRWSSIKDHAFDIVLRYIADIKDRL